MDGYMTYLGKRKTTKMARKNRVWRTLLVEVGDLQDLQIKGNWDPEGKKKKNSKEKEREKGFVNL